ncbi:MAG: HYExAFE family protein, partial [Planctomycetota bacterium]
IVSPAVGSPGSAEPLGGGYAPATRWLVDVKGRRFPSGTKQPQYWGNWSTEDDLRSLACWRQEFGGAFESALVFAYQLTAERSPTPPEQVFYHGDTPYAFVGIRLDDYRSAARRRSAKWGTVSVPIADFRTLAEPLRDLFDGSPPENTGSSPAGNAAFAPAQGLSAGVQ